MEVWQKKYLVSPYLLSLNEAQVIQLDQEGADGQGWEFYSNGHIMKAAVFRNQISGKVADGSHFHFVRIRAEEQEIMASCTCNQEGYLCKHIVALLYSWIYDREEFLNVETSLQKLQELPKKELIAIIGRMIQYDPQNIDYFDNSFNDAFDDAINGF
ncbi:hypothetical protein DRP98_08710 [candidate division KSB1 bacterium]|nr:SWIM zinc finger family protein [bacterium]OQX58831.1 MAG: hypothetical protein B5M50_03850 [candidate division KSB1 bacterium 4484_219]RKY78986.1 MAG: hypothetical protein DRQ00_04345 [candidate division KSB1 bacterium]HDI51952.1 SWIM zinc finger family protein [Bacteroidota bacterium]RKY80514.1 MAG: hypothetical protein DRQ12_00930 [candidate division KSB1 bacterium]